MIQVAKIKILVNACVVVRDALRFINPYALDEPSPNPEPTFVARRMYGALGGTIAVALIALPVLENLQAARFNVWQLLVYILLAVFMILVGMSMGTRLRRRWPFKICLGHYLGVWLRF